MLEEKKEARASVLRSDTELFQRHTNNCAQNTHTHTHTQESGYFLCMSKILLFCPQPEKINCFKQGCYELRPACFYIYILHWYYTNFTVQSELLRL